MFVECSWFGSGLKAQIKFRRAHTKTFGLPARDVGYFECGHLDGRLFVRALPKGGSGRKRGRESAWHGKATASMNGKYF